MNKKLTKEEKEIQKQQILEDMKKSAPYLINRSNVISRTDGSDIYEAYIFSLVIRAAQKKGARVYYKDIYGNVNPRKFIFRSSPGNIFSTRHAYSYAVIEFQDKPPLEVHVGIKVTGHSKVSHECDVAVIKQGMAIFCRKSGNVLPSSTGLLIGIECKFYSCGVSLMAARSFKGMVHDFSTTDEKDYYFVSNTHSKSVAALLGYKRKKHNCQSEIIPKYRENVDSFQSHLGEVFAKYKECNH